MASSNPLTGRVWKYGDNVNTDLIFPGKYTYTVTKPKEMAQYALEDLDPLFVKEHQPGDLIVAGRNWGCGSSREQAVVCLVEAGVSAIIAESFARIFYRNAINNGLLLITCPPAVQALNKQDSVSIDLSKNEISCGTRLWNFPPISSSVVHLVQAGGLIPYLKQKLAQAP